VDIQSEQVNIRYVVDRESKLPLRVSVLKGSNNGQLQLIKNVDLVTYDEIPPAESFEFQIPSGARVVDHSIISTKPPTQALSPAVIAWVMNFHANALKNSAITKPIHTNTQVKIIDRELRMMQSGVLEVSNNSDKSLADEVDICGFSHTNVEAYDSNGVKQQTRLAKSLFRNNHYRLHLTPNPPLAPGEVRQYLYVIGQPQQLHNANSERLYYLDLQNYFGVEVLESFVLVTPIEVAVKMQTENFVQKEQVGDVSIYVWQKHVSGTENHHVKVGLDAGSLNQ